MFKDAEGDMHEFAHDRAEGGLLGLSGSYQAFVQSLDVGGTAQGHHRGHVQLGAQVRWDEAKWNPSIEVSGQEAGQQRVKASVPNLGK